VTTYRYHATASRGSGFLLAEELKALGAADARETGTVVSFSGDLETGYRACIGSRIANRILCTLAEFEATDADSLYAGARALDWPAIHAPGASIAVQASGTTPALNNTQFTALKVKDAVVDALRDARGERPSVEAKDPDLALFVRLHKGRATLSFDLAGRPLHRRGYRREAGDSGEPVDSTAFIEERRP
jgi:23S rRNA (guanine2445-N2)-methyltransferase / 23S rRNA (guanine2069-N7)-methyltransferase